MSLTPADAHLPARGPHHGWQQLEQSLHQPWMMIAEPATGVRLVSLDPSSLLLELPATAPARHRRGLHRAGFRVLPPPHAQVWRWTAPTQALPEEPQAVWLESVASRPARQRLLRGQVLHVLRDVLHAWPQDVVVVTPEPEDDGCDLGAWDDPEDEWDEWDGDLS